MPSSKGSRPLYQTKRQKRRRSYVDEVNAVAVMLGFELMPHQAEALGPALEYRVRDGVFYRHDVVITWPRQQGKSFLMGCLAAWRAMKWPDQSIMFIAQTRMKAADQLSKLGLALTRAGVEGVRWYRGVGSEQLMFDNGSRIFVDSPNVHSGHGASTDLVILDEGHSLEAHTLQGIIPTQLAKPMSQLYIISTQGSEDSLVWNSFVERGRDSVADRAARTCYQEYAADLDAGDEILNQEHWGRWMPALGRSVTAESVQAGIDVLLTGEGMGGVLRAYGNVQTATDEEAIPMEWWTRSLDPYTPRPELGIVFAFDVNVDPLGSAIAAAWKRDDGRFHVEIVESLAGEGSGWLLRRTTDLVTKHRAAAVATVGGFYSREVAAQVKKVCETRVVPFRMLAINDYAAACGGFIEALRMEDVTHGDHPMLMEAVRRVRMKPIGHQAGFDSKASSVDVSPLVAAAVAMFTAREYGASSPEYAIY